jgi:hypothetical protein
MSIKTQQKNIIDKPTGVIKQSRTGVTNQSSLNKKAVEPEVNHQSDEEPERDDYYYGDIPSNITKDSLVGIMVKGLLKYRKEYVPDATSEDLINLLDGWFEHDDNNKSSKFSHLVPDDGDEFFDLVTSKLDAVISKTHDNEDSDVVSSDDEKQAVAQKPKKS